MARRDDAGFSDFVRASSPQLLRTAWLLCGSRTAAEDLVQGSLERVLVVWHRIQHEAALSYTRRVMVNLHIDTGRRRKKEHLTGEVPDVGIPDQTGNVGLADHLQGALRSLPARERQCVVLRFHADLSEADVAELLGVSTGTVKSSTSRGLGKLRQALVLEGEHHV